MQDNINGIAGWAKMKLNSEKTQVLIISTSKDHLSWKPALFLNGKQLELVGEYKFLGVIIDS